MEVSIIKAVKDYTREETYQEHTPLPSANRWMPPKRCLTLCAAA